LCTLCTISIIIIIIAPASEMTYIVSGGALNSTQSKPGGATDGHCRARFSLSAPLHSRLNVCYDNSGVIRDHKSRPVTCHVPALRGHLGIARPVCPMAQLYAHAGCLQLSHRRPRDMCGQRTHRRPDVDPPRFLTGSETICHRRTAIGGGGHIVSPPPGR